jgi:hypothetical protein
LHPILAQSSASSARQPRYRAFFAAEGKRCICSFNSSLLASPEFCMVAEQKAPKRSGRVRQRGKGRSLAIQRALPRPVPGRIRDHFRFSLDFQVVVCFLFRNDPQSEVPSTHGQETTHSITGMHPLSRCGRWRAEPRSASMSWLLLCLLWLPGSRWTRAAGSTGVVGSPKGQGNPPTRGCSSVHCQCPLSSRR